MADATCLALLEQEVEQAVVQESALQTIYTASANAMQQVIVNIVDTQTLEGAFVYFFRSVKIPQTLVLIRHLRGNVVLIPGITAQCAACLVFVPATLIHGGRVKIIHTVSNGIVHQSVNILLVVRETHHAKAQQGDLLARTMLHTIGHLHRIVTAYNIIWLLGSC